MAYDEELAERVREVLAQQLDVAEKRMFGGLAFLAQGNMACGVLNDDLIVRLEPEGYADALAQTGVRVFDFTGRVMKGWVVVGAEGHDTPSELAEWVSRGLEYARSLPAK